MTGKLLTIIFGLFFSYTTAASQLLPEGPQVLTFFSDLDDTEQPYGLYLPVNYDAQKKYPLVIMLHGAGSNHRLALRRVFGKSNANGENDVEATRYFPDWRPIDYIVASPFARGTAGYQGVPEQDVYDVLADIKKRFNIDEDRTYLTGLSMGGGGTLWIGLTRPDLWAALAPVCPAPPSGTEHYLKNGFNLPIHFFHGDADRAVPVTVSRDWVKKLTDIGAKVQYDEYPGVEHNSWEIAYKDEAVFTWFSQFKRNLFPDQVKLSTTQHKYSKAYWLRIDGFDPGKVAEVEARFSDVNQLEVVAKDVKGFTMKIAGHPKYNAAQTMKLTLNGKTIKVADTDSLSLVFKDGKWQPGKMIKTPMSKKAAAEGPVMDAISQRHIYVYGTQGDPSQEEQKSRMEVALKAANWSYYRNAFLGRISFFPRVVADKDVRPSDLKSSNLVLFGTKETNSIIQKYADKLPLHLSPGAVDVSLTYVYPVEGHYFVVNSGLPWWHNAEATGPIPPMPHQLIPKMKDLLLFKDSQKNRLLDIYFDDEWRLSTEQKRVLNANSVQTSTN